MRFSVDAHAIGRHQTGNEVYVRNLLRAFAALDKKSDFVAYYSAHDAPGQIPERFLTRRVSSNPFVRLGVELGQRVRRDKPDLLHVQYTSPLACSAPVVATVHDVSFLERPEFFPPSQAMQLRWTVKRTVRRAAWVITVSEFSRRSIENAYGPLNGRISVIPNGGSTLFRPVAREVASAWVSQHMNVRSPFVLTVGDLQPRKNQLGLIHAFADMIRAHPELPHHLVLAGKDTWHSGEVHQAAKASGAGDRIRFTGLVTDDELRHLYGACELFVFPSFYEGFGLPILEAMACGRAVACSNTSAMPEVANAAGILFDPHSKEEIVRAMLDLLLNPELRLRMERLGLKRAAQFTWERTARQTLDVYYQVAGARRRAANVKKAKTLPV
ncbi:MAG: glycosyltransferase family 1 protein [Bryobacteraceae bacterium]|nr:glycosyltransferase family 1 protein [Bryobacteraceae bacterium]